MTSGVIKSFYMGLLLEPDYDLDDLDYHGCRDEGCALVSALHELVRQERPIVAKALLEGLGGPSQLLVSLWRSRYPAIEPEPEPADTGAASSTRFTTGILTEREALEQFLLWNSSANTRRYQGGLRRGGG